MASMVFLQKYRFRTQVHGEGTHVIYVKRYLDTKLDIVKKANEAINN